MQLHDGASRTTRDGIAPALKAYRAAAAGLLSNKYAELASIAPAHLRERGNIFVAVCTDGILVRYDKPGEGELKVRVGEMDEKLATVALQFSEHVIYLDVEPHYPEKAPKISMAVGKPGEFGEPVATMAIALFASATPTSAFKPAKPPARPTPFLSIVSEMDIELAGEVLPLDSDTERGSGDAFLAHSRFHIPVGWRAIELYPEYGIEYWSANAAPMWAEMDILAAAAQRNLQKARYDALDTRVDTRAKYDTLLNEFQRLLLGPEEPMHQFLKQHPELISPTCDKYWSKLRFGDRISDFVFREPGHDYVLVELEAPIKELFRKDGQQREELTHAFNQLADWIRFIEDNRTSAEEDLGLKGISTNPRSLIVIGRSGSLSDENRRKLVTLQNQIPKLRIMTYDDLLASARATLEKLLGPLGFSGQVARMYFFGK